MARRRFPAGVQDFAKVIEGGFVYFDKTEYIYELTHYYGEAIFLSRPRRFGKSLLCSTLRYYFQGRKDLFKGLAIDSLETEWKQYPVFHFDMSRCKEDNLDVLRSTLNQMLSQYEKVYNCDAADLGAGARLQQLIVAAHEQTGNQAVLIFDEYDSPLLNVIDDQGKMAEIRSLFTSLYGPVKYMSEHLRFVFLTGITKFSQMSIFSTINNLTSISMHERWEGLCGITAEELETQCAEDIERLAEKFRITPEAMLQRLRERYDGYHFGPGLIDVYNPFSIVNVFNNSSVEDYWFAAGTPSALIKTLSHYNFEPSNLEGATVQSIGFDQPFDNFGTAIPILYQSGYLTIKDYDFEMELYTLGIPNGEVRRGLFYTLAQYYLGQGPTSTNSLVMNIKRAIHDDDIDKVLESLKVYLASLPHHLSNKSEQDFETILRVLFNGIGTEVETEVQNAVGRCDVVLKNANTIYVLELKTSKNGTVDEALAQIDEKNYLIPYWNDPRRKVKVGVVVDTETRTIKEWKVVE